MINEGKLSGAVVKITMEEAHEKLGHCNKEMTRMIAQEFGWDMKGGTNTVCQAYAEGKQKQKHVTIVNDQANKEVATEVNGRVHLDISSVKRSEESR